MTVPTWWLAAGLAAWAVKIGAKLTVKTITATARSSCRLIRAGAGALAAVLEVPR